LGATRVVLNGLGEEIHGARVDPGARAAGHTADARQPREAQHQVDELHACLRDLREQLEAARVPHQTGPTSRQEVEDAQAGEIGCLTEELQADREELRGLRSEVDRLRTELDDARDSLIRAEQNAEVIARERDEATAERSRWGEEAARLRGERDGAARRAEHADRIAGELRDEIERVRCDHQAERDGHERILASLRAEQEAERARSGVELTARTAEVERLGRLIEELEAVQVERSRLRKEVGRLRGERDEARRELGEVKDRAEQADRLAGELRDEMEWLEQTRAAERAGHERALASLRGELEAARSLAEVERGRTGAAGESLADLERRLADTLDELRTTAGRAAAAEAEVNALNERLAARNGSAPQDDAPQDCLEELGRQLRQAREANQRLSALLGVFGVVKGPTSSAPRGSEVVEGRAG
jgi:uncharacterized coiled-coil DUF342 family protein